MSHNITSVDYLTEARLRVRKEDAEAFVEEHEDELPESHPFEDLEYDADGWATLDRFWMQGESSGNFYEERIDDLVAILHGDADLLIIWEGESLEGLMIRGGKRIKCDAEVRLVEAA